MSYAINEANRKLTDARHLIGLCHADSKEAAVLELLCDAVGQLIQQAQADEEDREIPEWKERR